MATDLIFLAANFNIGKVQKVARFGNGLINDTYLVRAGSQKYVLQKLHPIFAPGLLEDTEAITGYIHKKAPITPLLVRSVSGSLGFIKNKECWRMLTYIPGRCYETGVSPFRAFQAASLLGSFHNILSEFNYDFKHALSNFHDTDRRVDRLRKVVGAYKGTEKYGTLYPLAEEVFNGYAEIDTSRINSLPDRIIHGDLKINNIRFSPDGRKAISLLDLDTIGKHKLVTDISSAARTWCNPATEDDVKKIKFDLKVFSAMMKGYVSTAKFVTKEELLEVPEGLAAALLGLTSRFIADAFEESYFKLIDRYPNLYEQNRTKALAQLSLYSDCRSKKIEMLKIINKLCRQLS